MDEVWLIDSLGEAILFAIGAVVVGLALLHVINGVARVWGEFAKAMLGPSRRAPAPSPARDSAE